MKNIFKLWLIALFFSTSIATHAEDEMTGDTLLSCQAILCLATADRPGECSNAVARYRGIKLQGYSETLQARREFLGICPKGPTTPILEQLLDLQSWAEQYCGAERLNMLADPRIAFRENRLDANLVDRGCGAGMWCQGETAPGISNVLPGECQALANHPFTVEVMPKYVGTPQLGGYWVPPQNYQSALAAYNQNLPNLLAAQSGN